jgi:hypothetical protein
MAMGGIQVSVAGTNKTEAFLTGKRDLEESLITMV